MTIRIWLDGTQQGRVVAYSMTGKDFSVDHTPFFNVSYIYIERYTYIGEPHGEDGEVFIWKTESAYRKVRVVEGKLAGVLLLGNRHGTMVMFRAIGRLVPQSGPELAAPDFAWNELAGQDWDYFFIKSFILQEISG